MMHRLSIDITSPRHKRYCHGYYYHRQLCAKKLKLKAYINLCVYICYVRCHVTGIDKIKRKDCSNHHHHHYHYNQSTMIQTLSNVTKRLVK